MRPRLFRLRFGAAGVAMLLLAAACGSTGSTQSSTSNGLVVNTSVAPSSLDPAEECGFTDISVSRQTYAALTRYGSKSGPNGTTQFDPNHIQPDVAKSWDVSGDGLTYTFHLRSGLKFASGNPVDAAAVKFSLERALTMNGCGGYFIYDGTPGLIKSIDASDPATLVAHLSQPDPNLPQAWAQTAAGIVDPSVVNAHGGVQPNQVNQWMASNIAGYGPFTMQSYQANKQAVLVANPNFYQQPASKKITLNFIDSDSTLLLNAKSGSANVTLGMSKQSAHSLVGNSSTTVVSHPTSTAEQIGLANDKPPFNNPQVREALTYAVPYQNILDKIAYGYGSLYYGPLMPTIPLYNANLEKPRTYDLGKAKSLLQQSGVKLPVDVQMAVQAGNTIDQDVATAVQGTWKQLGINVNIQQLSATDYSNATENHQVQSYVRLDGPGVIDAGYFLGYDLKCGVGFNLTATCLPDVDPLIGQMRVTQDTPTRQKLMDQIAQSWVSASPKIPVYEDKYVTVLSNVHHYFFSEETDMRTWS